MEALSEAIGVSRPTLSRYFQDATSVRPSTRDRIRAGLERVDYVPNFFATRMNRRRTGLIGVLFPYFNDLFYTSLLGAIETAALEAGYTTIAQSSHGDPALEARAIEMLLSMNLDGVIVAPLGESSAVEGFERLSAALPLLFVDSELPDGLPGIDFVGTDNRQSVGLIVDYLCRTGPPPVFLPMPAANSNSIGRESAYRSLMREAGHRPELIRADPARGTWDFEAHAADLMDAHFSGGAHRDATILCANDRLAIGVIRAANRHGLLRRRDDGTAPRLRVAGHDDHPLSPFMTPALTTVAQDPAAIGRAAVSRLAERIDAGHPSTDGPIRTECKAALRVRESA